VTFQPFPLNLNLKSPLEVDRTLHKLLFSVDIFPLNAGNEPPGDIYPERLEISSSAPHYRRMEALSAVPRFSLSSASSCNQCLALGARSCLLFLHVAMLVFCRSKLGGAIRIQDSLRPTCGAPIFKHIIPYTGRCVTLIFQEPELFATAVWTLLWSQSLLSWTC
jgi:hypothetical protein